MVDAEIALLARIRNTCAGKDDAEYVEQVRAVLAKAKRYYSDPDVDRSIDALTALMCSWEAARHVRVADAMEALVAQMPWLLRVSEDGEAHIVADGLATPGRLRIPLHPTSHAPLR